MARIWQRHEEKGIEVCWRGGPGYPDRLGGDPEAPAVLFCRGDPSVVDRYPTVALVGTRSPTRYGIGVAAQFGADLAAVGVSVVSGLALGIDGAAHEGATASGAPPVAVVAGGLDDPYPRRHERLWARVAEQGAVYSESPAGVRTERWRFPVRNRLLAMLSDLVVVVESRHGGGSMHTVEAAAARGIPVGPCRAPSAARPRRGPTPCWPRDVFRCAPWPTSSPPSRWRGWCCRRRPRPPPVAAPGPVDLGADRALLEALSSDPVSLDHAGTPDRDGDPRALRRTGAARPGGGGPGRRGVVGEDVVCVAVEGLFLDEPALPALRAAAVRSDGAGVDAVFLADGPLGDAVVLAAALGAWTTGSSWACGSAWAPGRTGIRPCWPAR